MPGVPPPNPTIYHITHVANLPGIIRDGCLWSDSERIRRTVASMNIGHVHIKARRLRRDVPTAAGGKLGDYVPFYFCNRSVMLYAVHRGHPDFSGGQGEIVHLVSSVNMAVRLGCSWTFTERHAELGYATYYDDLTKLSEIDWNVMPLQYWADSEDTKEKRQAEFLVHRQFPWAAIERVVVRDSALAAKVSALIGSGRPPVEIQPSWYY
jgi:hypothetical protein